MDRRGEMVFLMVGGLFSGCRLSTGIKALREGLQVCYFNTRRVQVNWFLMQFIKKKKKQTRPIPLHIQCFYLWLPLMIKQLLVEAAALCQA